MYRVSENNPIEFFTELSNEENVISGIAYTSEYGGGTANIEYEFLTQNSCRVLPVGSYVSIGTDFLDTNLCQKSPSLLTGPIGRFDKNGILRYNRRYVRRKNAK